MILFYFLIIFVFVPASLKTAFYGALDIKLTKLDDLVYILSELFNELDSKISSDNLTTVLRNPITDETYEVWQKTAHKVAKIEKKRKRNSELKTVFLTLFLQMGLQLFNDTKLATDSLNELFACYEKSRKSRKDSVNSLEETQIEDSEMDKNQTKNDPLWTEVVVDLFLNLLSHNSHLLRHLVNCVFPHLCQYMTPTAIHQILAVLDPQNDDNPLSKNDSDASDDDDEDDENEDKPHEEIEENEEDESESEASASEGDDNDEDNEKGGVNEKLRMALHEALNKNGGYQTDEESIDVDNLSETEGKELDKALANAFRQYRPNLGKHKKQSKDAQTLTHFRIRVLDLIEIYINSTPSMHLCLEIMLPLIQAIEFSIRDDHQLPLHNRLKSCLKKLTSLKKFSDTEGVDENLLGNFLKSLLEKGTKTTWIVQDMRVEIAQCCTFIIRCSDILASLDSTTKKSRKRLKETLTEIILTELNNYFHKRDSLTPIVLFKNILTLSWDGCLSLIPSLLQYIFDDDVKPFKKTQAAELLKIFYQNHRYLSVNTGKVNEYLNDCHEQFSENLVKLFVSLCEHPDERNVKEKFVCNIFNVLLSIKNCCLKVDNINWGKIGDVIREYRSHVTFSKDAKSAFNKLCSKLSISNIVIMKPRTTISNDIVQNNNEGQTENNINKKKMKKTKNKEKLKMKKEAKQMRLQSLSEGMSSMDFTEASAVDVDRSIEELQNGDEEKDLDNTHSRHELKFRKRKGDHQTDDGVRKSKQRNISHNIKNMSD